ncbi:MAG TPA: hypothetical protein VN883_00955, partial [Myxococcales bacterium]|nr:hypothetical protein [Myxococcales bacterium]
SCGGCSCCGGRLCGKLCCCGVTFRFLRVLAKALPPDEKRPANKTAPAARRIHVRVQERW